MRGTARIKKKKKTLKDSRCAKRAVKERRQERSGGGQREATQSYTFKTTRQKEKERRRGKEPLKGNDEHTSLLFLFSQRKFFSLHAPLSLLSAFLFYLREKKVRKRERECETMMTTPPKVGQKGNRTKSKDKSEEDSHTITHAERPSFFFSSLAKHLLCIACGE